MNEKHYVAFDLETTGLDTGLDRIIEFCFVRLDAELRHLETLSSLVNPERPISPENSAIHGIFEADVQGLPNFSAHASKIQGLVQEAVLIAHNGSFDLATLNAELLRCGLPGLAPNHPLIDTLVIERFVNGHKLEDAYLRYQGQALVGAHRAESDTLATIDVLRGQRRVHSGKLPGGLDSLLNENIQNRAGFEQKEYLDHDRRFFRDGNGVVRFNFGQHRGEEVKDKKGYLEWMVRRDFSPDTIKVVKSLLVS